MSQAEIVEFLKQHVYQKFDEHQIEKALDKCKKGTHHSLMKARGWGFIKWEKAKVSWSKSKVPIYWYEPECNNCGRCCHHMKNGELEPCQFLVKLKDGKTKCRIYEERLNTITDDELGNFCKLRKDSYYDYEGCPYNTNKPIFRKDKTNGGN